MADMSLDELLSSSLKSAAEPAASAGVADAIRARVAAGDAGTSVAGSTAPGWTSGGSAASILPWLGLIVVGGVVGALLGVTGVIGAPAGPPDDAVPAYVLVPDTAVGFACPGGPEAGTLPAGTRVLAVQRSEDSSYLGVRNPNDLRQTLWFEAGDIVVDPAQTEIGALPVGSCPEVTVTVVTPTPTPEPTQEPEPGETDEPQPQDTTAPVIGKATVSPNPIGSCAPAQSAIVSVTASDNVGVAGVTVSWSGSMSGSAQMSFSGGAWKYTFTPPNGANGGVTFATQARDAAGNVSPVATTSVLNYNCIF